MCICFVYRMLVTNSSTRYTNEYHFCDNSPMQHQSASPTGLTKRNSQAENNGLVANCNQFSQSTEFGVTLTENKSKTSNFSEHALIDEVTNWLALKW